MTHLTSCPLHFVRTVPLPFCVYYFHMVEMLISYFQLPPEMIFCFYSQCYEKVQRENFHNTQNLLSL